MSEELICKKCNVPLTVAKTTFSYLKHEFYADLPCCPVCGLVYVSEDLANGRMASVEMQLEDK